MPIVETATLHSEKIWEQGDKILYRALLTTRDGQKINVKTFSKAIAEKGFTGQVETYEKSGKYGSETFARQAKKDTGGYSKSQSKSEDNYTMYLSYAKDLVVAKIMTGGADKLTVQELANEVSFIGKQLYDQRPGGNSETTAKGFDDKQPAKQDSKYEFFKSEGDVTNTDEPEMEVSKNELNALFPEES